MHYLAGGFAGLFEYPALQTSQVIAIPVGSEGSP